MAHRHFKSGSGVFTCLTCNRRTRQTTQWQTEAEFCGECEELHGLQNAVFDDGVLPGDLTQRDKLLAKIAQRGGDTDAVKRAIPDLFSRVAA